MSFGNKTTFGVRLATPLVFLAALTLSTVAGGDSAAADKSVQRAERILELLLHDDMLTPAKVTVPAGRYKIVVHNALVTGSVDFQLDDGKGSKQSESKLKASSSTSTMIFDLKEGEYVLHAVQRAKWRCTLTVTKKEAGKVAK
jgi:hypothetical protein